MYIVRMRYRHAEKLTANEDGGKSLTRVSHIS